MKFIKFGKIDDRFRGVYLMLFILLLFIPVKSFSQISIQIKNKPIKEILRSIEKKSDYSFFYQDDLEDIRTVKSINIKDKPIQEVLDTLFFKTKIIYKIDSENIIVLSNSPEKQSLKDNKKISGRVIDMNEEPIVGANVLIKGRNIGGSTDMEGAFILEAPEGSVLSVSYIGYISQNILVGKENTYQIKLAENTEILDEIVVIGYGTAKRRDLTGSVSSLKLEDSPLAVAMNISPLDALHNTTPGLVIGATNSAGGTPSMIIRGQNSINGSNNPLIVLDGVVYLGSLNDINPNDIASYDILKDASSAAVYGSRAANGVIVITSKKGKIGKPTVAFNTSVGVQIWQQKPDLMSADQFIEMRQYRMKGADPLEWLEEPEKENYKNGRSTDWIDLVSRNGLVQNHQVSVSGGAKSINYYLSGSYTDQKGVIIGDEYSRITLRAKVDTDITDWFKIGIDGGYNYSDFSGVGANLQDAMTMSPYGSPYRDEGKKLYERWPTSQSTAHPLWQTTDVRDNTDQRNNFRILGYAHVDIPFVKGLSYRFNYLRTGDFKTVDNFTYESNFISEGTSPDRYSAERLRSLLSRANGSSARTNGTNYVIDNIVNYKCTFGKHAVDGTLVATRDYAYSKTVTATGNDFSENGNTTLGVHGLHKAGEQKINLSSTKRTNIGYLGRASYTYDDRYYLTATYRRDGASVFGVNNKWGNFPAVGAAWTISNEGFFKNATGIVNRLKIRVSYGKNGNQGIGPYSTLSTVNNGPNGQLWYEFSDNPSKVLYGMNVASLGNTTLGWETTTALNTGVEASFLNNRIRMDLDVYFSKTTDQLFTRNIPGMTGYTSISASMGQVDNKGVELMITSSNIETKNFNWTSSLTFWLNRNVLAKLYGDDLDGDGKEDDDIGNSRFIGKSLGAIYGFEPIGVVQEEDVEYMQNVGAKPGDIKFRDLNGDGFITAQDDRKILGYNKANFRLNLSNTFSYRNFELYIHLAGIFGGNGYYLTSNRRAFIHASSRHSDNSINHPWWTPENRNNKYPSADYNDDKFLALQSRSFVRIQDITLSYRFTQSWMKNMNINSLKVFIAGKNLYTFTGWVGGDPEKGVQARSGEYPVPSSYTMGLNVSF